MARLQIAIDSMTSEQAVAVADDIHDIIDIFEVGTPMIIRDGLQAVRLLKEKHPDMIVLADAKIVDGGSIECEDACRAGADIITVLAVSDATTPAIAEKDILIIASGSGETSTIVAIADKARKIGAEIGLITSRAGSTLGKMSDRVVILADRRQRGNAPVQIGAAAFEQSVLVLGDAMAILLAHEIGIADANGRMQKLHANLE